MNEYLDIYQSTISNSQRATLNSFIEQSAQLKVSMLDPLTMLKDVGSKLYTIPSNPTNPDEYNKAIMGIITDLTALYQELDRISYSMESLHSINMSELKKLEQQLDSIEKEVYAKIEGAKNLLDYTASVSETFSTDTCATELIPDHTQKLHTDTQTSSLKRAIVANVSRTLSKSGNHMCKIYLEDILGISTETRNGVENLVDGNYSTCWREVVLSDTPIIANRYSTPWLPANYTGGAAALLRVEFDYMTPITEFSLKPACPYPMHLLDITWTVDTRNSKASGSMITFDGDFSGGLSDWTSGTVNGTLNIGSTDGLDGTQCLIAYTSGSSSYGYIEKAITLSGNSIYAISFLAKSVLPNDTSLLNPHIEFEFYGNTEDANSLCLMSKRIAPPTEWKLINILFRVPETVTPSSMKFTFKGTGTTYLDDIQINKGYTLSRMATTQITDETTIHLTVDRNQAIPVRTMWLTLAQPHYTLKTFDIPEGFTEIKELWDAALTKPEDNIISFDSITQTSFSKPRIDLPQDTILNQEINKIGGKLKEMVLKLYSIANPSVKRKIFTKYEYVFGGWELDLRYREFVKSGIWVSKPLNLQGEIRQLRLLPNATSNYANEIKYYVQLDQNATVNTSKLSRLTANGNYLLNIRVAEEQYIPLGETSGSTTTTVISKDYEEVIQGTDRYRKAKLGKIPYTNREKVANIVNTLATSDASKLVVYDPNTAKISYPVTSTAASTWTEGVVYSYGLRVSASNNVYFCTSGHTAALTNHPATGTNRSFYWVADVYSLKSLNGYVPIQVELEFEDYIARPDVIGYPQNTISTLITKEPLTLESAGSTITETTESTKTVGSVSKKAIEENKITQQSYSTKYPVEWDEVSKTGHRISIYWHDESNDTTALYDVSNDILINPAHYEIEQIGAHKSKSSESAFSGKTRIIIKSEGFNQLLDADGTENSSYIPMAYYRTKVPAARYFASQDYQLETIVVSGISNLLSQTYPVTRNMTDYVNKNIPTLKKCVLDKTSKDYYPIYEYYVNTNGELVFADDLFRYGDTPANIKAKYKTLDINPRIVIEMTSHKSDGCYMYSPEVYDYTVLVNSVK